MQHQTGSALAVMAQHLVANRGWWFQLWQGQGNPDLVSLMGWDPSEGGEPPVIEASELVVALKSSWEMIAEALAQWTSAFSQAMAGTRMIGGTVTNHIQVTLEIGPKGKKVVAVAADWPGLERGAKTEEAAIERLLSYVPRYAMVTKLAGMKAAFATTAVADLIERYPGTGSTDFWGISFAFSGIDQQAMSGEELDRELTLMQACWAFFDDVRSRVSAEMQRGPRGGGRDRDHIVRHTFAAEQGWAKGIGVLTPDGAMLTDEGLKAHRDAYCFAIWDYHSQGKWAGTRAKWPLRYLIRHTAFHTLDHAWEMEDKDSLMSNGLMPTHVRNYCTG